MKDSSAGSSSAGSVSGSTQSVVIPPAAAAAGSRGDGLAMLRPRLAETGAQIHQAGRQAGAAGIEHLRPLRRGQPGAEIGDDAVAHQQDRAGPSRPVAGSSSRALVISRSRMVRL